MRPFATGDGDLVPDRQVELEGRIHLDTGRIAPNVEPAAGTPQAALLDRLRARLAGDRLDSLRVRWHRVKHQDDTDEWRTVDWSRADVAANVPFCEVFPNRWDLSLVLDRKLYWVVDLWCMNPGCSCDEVALDVHSEDGGSKAFLVVDLSRWHLSNPDVSETGRRLWECLRADDELVAELKSRRTKIRRVARKLPSFLDAPKAAPKPPPVGRNEPCPCGSGKKFKRCCGGVTAL